MTAIRGTASRGRMRDGRDPRRIHVAGNAVTKASGVLLSMGTAVLLARTLGADQYGIYAYSLALVSMLMIPAQFGLPDLIVRETARAETQGDWRAMRGLWRWSLGTAALGSATVMVAAGGIGFLLGEDGRQHYLPAILLALPLIPTLVWLKQLSAALTGLRRVILGQIPELLVHPATLLILVFGATWLQSGYELSALHAVTLTLLSAAGGLVLALVLLRHARPPASRTARPVYHQRAWLVAAIPLALVGGTHLIILHTDILILGLFSTPGEGRAKGSSLDMTVRHLRKP